MAPGPVGIPGGDATEEHQKRTSTQWIGNQKMSLHAFCVAEVSLSGDALGGEVTTMRRLLLWTIFMAVLVWAGTSSATSDEPFIRVSTSPDEIDLGTAIFFAGIHEVPGALTVEVESNCWHGPIIISTTPLERQGGGLIEPDDIFVRTPGMGRYVSLKKPVVILPTAAGSQEVVVDFKVHAGLKNPSGQYKGMITLTIVPPV
jgi:hypothetical protein